MVRQPFQIDTLRVLLHQQGFTVPGTAADKHHRLLRLLDGHLNRRLAQGLIATADQRVVDTRLFQPGLRDMRALAAARAAEKALRMGKAGYAPGVDAGLTRVAAHQAMAERQRGVRSLTFITGADGGALVIVH